MCKLCLNLNNVTQLSGNNALPGLQNCDNSLDKFRLSILIIMYHAGYGRIYQYLSWSACLHTFVFLRNYWYATDLGDTGKNCWMSFCLYITNEAN